MVQINKITLSPKQECFHFNTHYLLNRFQEKDVLHLYCFQYIKYNFLLELYVSHATCIMTITAPNLHM